jgi:hypothetical protein
LKIVVRNRGLLQAGIIVFLLFLLFFKLSREIKAFKKRTSTGLISQLRIVDFLYQKNKNKEFCLRIYTPPVIPYTYNYLFSYYSRVKHFNSPTTDYKDKRCWYIIEEDPYKFRIEKWRKENIPTSAKRVYNNKFNKSVEIELWEDQLK